MQHPNDERDGNRVKDEERRRWVSLRVGGVVYAGPVLFCAAPAATTSTSIINIMIIVMIHEMV